MNRVLRSADDLLSSGLISGAEAEALRAAPAPYAVPVTPAMASPIAPPHPASPTCRPFVPPAAPSLATP